MAKTLGIKIVDQADLDKFEALKKSHSLTSTALLTELLRRFDQQPSEVNQDQAEEIKKLTAALDARTAEVSERHSAVIDLEEEVMRLNSDNLNLYSEIEKIKNAQPTGLQLSGTQYVVNPSPAIQKNMVRAIILADKRGKLNRKDPEALNLFTCKAIIYFIKNEFPEVLK